MHVIFNICHYDPFAGGSRKAAAAARRGPESTNSPRPRTSERGEVWTREGLRVVRLRVHLKPRLWTRLECFIFFQSSYAPPRWTRSEGEPSKSGRMRRLARLSPQWKRWLVWPNWILVAFAGDSATLRACVIFIFSECKILNTRYDCFPTSTQQRYCTLIFVYQGPWLAIGADLKGNEMIIKKITSVTIFSQTWEAQKIPGRHHSLIFLSLQGYPETGGKKI